MGKSAQKDENKRAELRRSAIIASLLLALLICTPAFLAANEVISLVCGLGGSGERILMSLEDAERYRMEDADQSLTDSADEVVQDADAQIAAFLEANQEIINADEGDIINIMLIGCDAYEYSDHIRSDSMMILSIDKDGKVIKLTSLMRDMRVHIPGYGYDKLNAAFAYDSSGQLLLDTIEENFLIKIEDYVCINYRYFREAIDLLGGMELEIIEEEIDAINACIGVEKYFITQPGVQHLNGLQTLGYCQMRKVGTDTGRTARQRIVMTKLLRQAGDLSLLEMRDVIETMLPGLKTNMSKGEMFYLALQAVSMGDFEIEQMRVPMDGTWYDLIKNKIWYVGFNYDKNVAALHDFIYGSDEEEISSADAPAQ